MPYADYNCLKLPDDATAKKMKKLVPHNARNRATYNEKFWQLRVWNLARQH